MTKLSRRFRKLMRLNAHLFGAEHAERNKAKIWKRAKKGLAAFRFEGRSLGKHEPIGCMQSKKYPGLMDGFVVGEIVDATKGTANPVHNQAIAWWKMAAINKRPPEEQARVDMTMRALGLLRDFPGPGEPVAPWMQKYGVTEEEMRAWCRPNEPYSSALFRQMIEARPYLAKLPRSWTLAEKVCYLRVQSRG